MTIEHGSDDTALAPVSEGHDRPAEAEVRNEVAAAAMSGVVQAGTVVGGVHIHSALPAVPTPRQLPPAPPVFVGRAPELAALSSALDPERHGDAALVSVLAGAGGMGKTWLVSHWAHHHADRFPDGQLFVDLQGFSPAGPPLEPTAVLRGFLEALDVAPGRVPSDLHSRTAMFRSLVEGRRILIVLDNAADVEQVAPLLPGASSCSVVVTSRSHLAGLVTRFGANLIRIGALVDDEPRWLLVARLGADRVDGTSDAVSELLGLCAGHPLALAIVAGRAQAAPHVGLAELAEQLRDPPTRLAALAEEDPASSLPTVLDWSLRALAPELHRVLGLLAIAPGPDIDPAAAASLAALSLPAANAAFRVLMRASLVDRDNAGRYRMHDLVRLHAHDLCGEPERSSALRRVVGFYLHTAHAGDRHLNPHATPLRLSPPAAGCEPLPLAPDDRTIMTWFDTNHRCLLAAQQVAAARGWHDATWSLARVLFGYHYRRGHARASVAVWRAGLDAAKHLDDTAALTLAHRNLGLALSRVGEDEPALPNLQRALSLARLADYRTQQAHTHRALAVTWERLGSDERALAHATDALRLYRELGSPAQEGDALNAVGRHAARLGDHERARAHCEAALAVHRRNHDADGAATAMKTLGEIAHRDGDLATALGRYQRALELYLSIDNSYAVAETLDVIGHLYAALGHHELARTAWTTGLRLYESQGRETHLAAALRQLDGPSG
ncbi:ATP-binding protein [Saccharothrix deserti]|uniref:ATP-binding protein n=1 Tax=Saccharothrix deserti TaxID=2593674 RepID=UPI00131BCB34|nr:tetratricopeptide repeat protein [Saccharothrix deserti]